jgi:membrane protease YdiL (CAAX protease family)
MTDTNMAGAYADVARSKADQAAERDPIGKSVVLHLLPGLLALGLFTLLARPVENLGFPSMMPWLVSVLCVLLPFELGYLLYQGRRRNGRFSLSGVIAYRQRLSAPQIVLWTAVTFAAVLVLFVLSGPATNYLQARVFAWVPGWFVLDTGIEGGGYTRSALLLLNAASVLVFVIGVPIVEEMYFRGYLLPRISYLGMWGVPANALLFALYHFTTPWVFVTRVLITLPLAYVAYRKQNILPGIVVHAIANSVDVVMGFLYLLGM